MNFVNHQQPVASTEPTSLTFSNFHRTLRQPSCSLSSSLLPSLSRCSSVAVMLQPAKVCLFNTVPLTSRLIESAVFHSYLVPTERRVRCLWSPVAEHRFRRGPQSV